MGMAPCLGPYWTWAHIGTVFSYETQDSEERSSLAVLGPGCKLESPRVLFQQAESVGPTWLSFTRPTTP